MINIKVTLFLILTCYSALANSVVKNDVRILIDVSGSMQQNDINNLRIPALELLIHLLANDSQAGVWLFAEQTHKLVPLETVNSQWKKNALTKINRIHSRGLLTDIETALHAATVGWEKPTSSPQRVLILLTDGVVDVSAQSFMQSAESRERILSELSTLFKKNNIKVYSIALSTQADSDLLRQLAKKTDGWYELARSAEQLQRIFFRIFQKAIPVATVPLNDNVFTIDSSINEFSALIFRKNKTDTSKLIAPSGMILGQESTSAQLHWHYQDSYDLVTVKSPEAGQWKIKADVDPDNQVMIVTDLQLRTSVLPNYLNAGEQLAIEVYFTDAQKIITRADFLNFIDLKLQINNMADVNQSYAFIAQLDKLGFFNIQLPEFDQEGIYHLDISANGKSFQRVILHSLAVLKTPISMTYKMDAQQVMIDFVPDAELIDTEMLHIAASIQAGDAMRQNVIVTEQAGQWQLMIRAPEPEQQVQVSFAVQAQTVAGVAITPALQDLLFTHDMFVVESVPLIIKPTDIIEQTTDLELQRPVTEVVAAIDQATELAEEELSVEEVQFNWPVIAVVATVNLLLIIVGYFGFRFYKNKLRAQRADVLGRLE